MTDTDRFADALTVARHFDEDAFACDFGGRTAINLPNLDAVISLTQPAAPAEGLRRIVEVVNETDRGMEDRIEEVHAIARSALAAPAEGLREAAQEMSDALDAPGPSDPIDGEPLTREEVNEAWERHGLRVDVARDALRAALKETTDG